MGKRIHDYLSVVFAIYKRDLLRIVRNPLALIVLLGACVLPSAYAWFTTAANWDPYQSTENVRIAVANEDVGATSARTGNIQIGSEVVSELKENHELGWTFYSTSEEAINSVYEGTCYAAIIFPKDFSSDFVSIITGDFKQPTIDYYLNEKISPSAPDFTNEGANVIQEDIDQSFVNTVSDVVLGITQKVGNRLVEKGTAAQTALISGIGKANDALEKTQAALTQIDPAIDNMITASSKAEETMENMQASIPTMKDTLTQARSDLEKTRNSANTYGEQLQNALNKGAVDLGKAASEASISISKTSAEITKIYAMTNAALAEAQSALDQNQTIIDMLEKQPLVSPQIIDALKSENDRLSATIGALEGVNDSLYSSLEGIDDLLEKISESAKEGTDAIGEASTQLNTQISPALNKSLDEFANSLGALLGIVLALEPTLDQAQTTVADLSSALAQSKTAASYAKTSLSAIQTRLKNTLTDINAIQSSSTIKELEEYLKVNPKETAAFISAPVKLETITEYPVKNYGSGVVAFFSSVAIWVAGFILIDLLKMRVSPAGLPPFTKGQAYWGRCLLFTTLGIISPPIICIGDLIMGIQCESPVAFVFAGIVSGVVYTNLIYALAHAFRYIGKALAVVYLIIQIPGSSGLFPIEMMPDFYQFLHPLLPFTYTIDAFHEAIGGFYGADYVADLCILFFVFMPLAIFIGIVLGRWASNLTLLLDRDIGKTGLFDGENVPKNLHLRLGTLLEALLHTPEYRKQLLDRVKVFKKRFPGLRLAGWILLAAQFLITFALMIIIQADVDTKLFLLAAMVIGVLIIDTYLIAIAYMRANLVSKESLVEHDDSEIADEIRHSLERRNEST